MEIAHHPDAIDDVEVTAHVPGDRVPVHVLGRGIHEPVWADIHHAR